MPAIDDPLPDEADEALELAPIEAPEEDEEDEETKEARAQERLNALGITLRDLFADYEQDRLAIEERWMQDLRQYNGVYDPEDMSQIRAAEGSELFLNITRPKTNTFSARMQDMLIPTDERNFGVERTPVPELADKLDDQQQAIDPETKQPMVAQDGTPVSNAAFASEIIEEAKRRASAMEDEIADQFAEAGYNEITRQVIDDLAVYGAGIAEGPVLTDKRRVTWTVQTASDGTTVYQRKELPDPKPVLRYVRCWDFYPDMSTTDPKGWRGVFEQTICNRREFARIAREMEFYEHATRQVLAEERRSSFIMAELWWVNEMRSLTGETTTTMSDLMGERYRLIKYQGELRREDLEAAELDVEKLGLTGGAYGVVWFEGDTVLKVALSPLDSGRHSYSIAYCERDPTSPFGFGIPRLMRNEQRAANASWRMLFDNAGLSVAPQMIIRKKGLTPVDGSYRLAPKKTWLADETVGDVRGAFGFVEVPSKQEELAGLLNMAVRFADDVTGQPLIAQGDQAPHITKTAKGMSILFNAANVVTRRVVKFFDDHYTIPMVERFYEWNMQFNKRPDIKGDFRCVGRGSSVLLEKEQQNETYMQALQLAQTPALQPLTDFRVLWEQALKNMRIEGALLSEERVAEEQQRQMQLAQEQAKAAEAQANAVKDPLAKEKLDLAREELALEREKHDDLVKVELAKIAASEGITSEKLLARVAEVKLTLDQKARAFNAEARMKRTQGSGI